MWPVPPSNKSLLSSRLWVMCSVMCPHISWPGPGLSQQKYHSCQNSRKENTFLADMPGDTWWWANGTEMSNISTVPDYKYLTKISQNFLNILVETYTSVCQSVKTSSEAEQGWAESWGLSTGLKVAHHLNCVSWELKAAALLLSVRSLCYYISSYFLVYFHR